MRKNNKNDRNNNTKFPLNKKLTTSRIFFHYNSPNKVEIQSSFGEYFYIFNKRICLCQRFLMGI